MGGKAHGGSRISLSQAQDMAQQIQETWLSEIGVSMSAVAGSVRRELPFVGDIDIVVIPHLATTNIVVDTIVNAHGVAASKAYVKAVSKGEWQPTMIDEVMISQFGFQKNGKPARSGLFNGVQIDLYLATKQNFGAMMAYATGSMDFNVMCRARAQRKGMMLNQYGLVKDGVTTEYESEGALLSALGIPWTDPKDRK